MTSPTDRRPAVPTGGVTTSPRSLWQRLSRTGQRIGVRARSVIVAVVVVFAALVVGGAVLLYTLENDLEQTATANARARASEVVAQLSTDGLDATGEAISQRTRGNSVLQILDADGTVIAASSNDLSRDPMSSQRPEVGEYTDAEADLDDIEHGAGGEWTVVTTATRLDDVTYFVQSAVPIGIQRDTIETVAVFLLAGTPLLLGSVAVAVWMLVGRALRSVESIRSTVAEIDSHRLTDRVAVPPTRDEIAALAATMNTMLDRLQVSDAAQRAFVSDASHELRSPLATLTSAGELAVTAAPERQTALLETMNLEIARLRGLVENLMTLARADTQELAAQRAEVDLDDLLGEELRRLRLTGGVRVVVEMAPARVLGDQQSLGQALRNVVDNAARHARTTVRLVLTVTATDAIVWVDNDGPTIPVEDRERVFERFVRLDEARTRDVGGSGLGLAISRAALRAHGGDARVVDGPDGWCRFELRLPRVAEA